MEALKKTPNEVHVISQYGAEGENVYPTYDANDEGVAKKIFKMAVRITPDIVHLQHEFGLYGEMNGIAVLELIYRFKSTRTPVIATFHTVNRNMDWGQKLVLGTMCRELDGIIVHEEDHAAILMEEYQIKREKISLIPHGARELEQIVDAKKKLDLLHRKVILLAGYFRPTKHFEKIVEIFPSILARVPDTTLVISGKLRVLEFSQYRKILFEKINSSPAKSRIEVFRGQFPQRTFDTILSASDIMAFPYSAGAQSGVMAHALTFGKPVIASKLPAFANIVQKAKVGFCADSDEEYIEHIVRLLTDKSLYEELSGNALNYVKNKISWNIVAEKTLKVYKQFDQKLECKNRYIYIV